MIKRDIIHEFVSCREVMKNQRVTSYMSKMINETDKDHKERFFKICSDNKNLRATKNCTGDECGVIPNINCNRGELTVGWFHTHPAPGKEMLSSNDIMYGIDKDFSCVGFKKKDKNKVLCFDYPYNINWYKLRESSDIFSSIESILKKGIKSDCEKILE